MQGSSSCCTGTVPGNGLKGCCTPSSGGQSSGLAGAQHPLSPLPGPVPVQQLLLPRTTPHTAQHIIYSSSLHQVQTPAFIAPHLAPLHGYAGPHTTTLGGVMVDPEERSGTTRTAYVVPASAAQPSPAVASDAFLTRLGDLERALCQVQD